MGELSAAILGDDGNVLAIYIVAFVLVLAILVSVLRCRRRTRGGSGGDEPEESPIEEAPVQPAAIPVSAGREAEESPEIGLPTMAEAVGGLAPGKLKSLLESRLEDMEDEETDTARAIAVVGALDELRILLPTASAEEQDALPGVQAAMERCLKAMGAERIDDDEWNPERQRAVEARKDLPVGAPPVLAEKVASGLLLNGRVARKQTVVLRTGA